MKLILTVKDSFEIESRGLVIVQKVYPDSTEETQVNIREKILLDNGKERIETFIKSIETLKMRTKPDYVPLALVLPKNIKKSDVPVGTKVYKIKETEQKK